ncbi:putative te1b-like protein [Erysiphe necator]|uniref:Putative te1b-like protein n=1 Tax=Uncinula necator TaxID=52586 RepID=A0A0B1PCT0_UNCNE|nr:putative te1b-like protein [Erysiphe necator]
MFLRNSGRLFVAKVYVSEFHGTMYAMEAILSSGKDNGYTTIYVMLDSSSAINALQSGITSSSAGRVENFQMMATISDAPVKVVWIPGHEDIARNVIADQLAREALNSQDLTGLGTRSLPKILTIIAIENQARKSAKELIAK